MKASDAFAAATNHHPRPGVTPSQLEQWMAAARPGLVRLARTQGIAPETANDVVQETLLEAWRHLDALVAPDGFSAWLAAICRNVCRRYHRAHAQRIQYEIPWGLFPGDEENATWPLLQETDFPDPAAVDPLEELDRHDLATLLDQALGHLPLPAREAIALCYLAGTPQQEAAQCLRLTIQALEARLHRARKQLRHILSGPLRSEALALGVAVDPEAPTGWRDTRLWCPSCGKARFMGIFERAARGSVCLRLRCTGCGYEVNSWGHVPLDGLRSFRPAYKRVMQVISTYFATGLARGWVACPTCGTPQPLHIVEPEALAAFKEPAEERTHRNGLYVVTACATCGRHHADSDVPTVLWTHPAVQRFLAAHPRAIAEPALLGEYQGQTAIRVRWTAIASAVQLTLFAHPQTLQVLAMLQT